MKDQLLGIYRYAKKAWHSGGVAAVLAVVAAMQDSSPGGSGVTKGEIGGIIVAGLGIAGTTFITKNAPAVQPPGE